MELTIILGISVIGLLFALYLIRDVMKRETGNEKMQEISNAIKLGAEAFLRRMNKTIGLLAVALACLIYILYAFVRAHNEHDPSSASDLALWTTVSFLLGAACSVAAGYMGMWVAIRANIRTAAGAMKDMNSALQPALRGGAVSGFFVVAMSLGVAGLFAIVKEAGVTADVTNSSHRRLRFRCQLCGALRNLVAEFSRRRLMLAPTSLEKWKRASLKTIQPGGDRRSSATMWAVCRRSADLSNQRLRKHRRDDTGGGLYRRAGVL
jgi:hypothetical protein